MGEQVKDGRRVLLSPDNSSVCSRTLKSVLQLLRVLGTLEPRIGAVCPLLPRAVRLVGGGSSQSGPAPPASK